MSSLASLVCFLLIFFQVVFFIIFCYTGSRAEKPALLRGILSVLVIRQRGGGGKGDRGGLRLLSVGKKVQAKVV